VSLGRSVPCPLRATISISFRSLQNQVVALKEIRLQEEEGAPFTAIREASLLKELKHANIVTLHDIVHTRETLTFVFEYVHTDLSQYLERHSGGLDSRNVRLFLFQLLRGLSYCHKRRVLHRDVKPQNLLISEIGELKLADFGLARAKSVPSHTYSHEVVTLWYRPPDVLLGSTEYSTSLDMWGVGCIFVEMITGMAIFPGVRDTYDQLDKIFKVLGTPLEEDWAGVTRLPGYKLHKIGQYKSRKLGLCWPRLHDVVQGEAMATALLQLDPLKRLGADDAMVHPYFSGLPKKPGAAGRRFHLQRGGRAPAPRAVLRNQMRIVETTSLRNLLQAMTLRSTIPSSCMLQATPLLRCCTTRAHRSLMTFVGQQSNTRPTKIEKKKQNKFLHRSIPSMVLNY
jgi:cyclin-dependent kinase 14